MKLFIANLNQIINRRDFISAQIPELNLSDSKRAKKIKNEQRLLQFLVGRLLLLEYLHTDFQTLESGKVVADNIFVSLAHSDYFVVLAIDDKPIGVDIEKIDETRDFKKIANRLKFKNCQTAQDFTKSFTAYEADFKLGKEHNHPKHQFFERDGFIICVSSLTRKKIELIEKNLL